MEFFTLEALPARYGDCLLLHFGMDAAPGLSVIDGGPGQVWKNFLSKRLQALKAKRGAGFKIDLMMVSHIDDDHVIGILDFTTAWKTDKAAGKPWPYPVKEFWHNSFERVSNSEDATGVTASVLASTGGASPDAADLEEAGLENTPDARAALKVLASVAKGSKLRADVKALGIPKNTGFDKLVKPKDGPSVPYKLGPGLTLTIVGPLADQLEALQKKFAEDLPQDPTLAAYADQSVPNLSSIAAVARYQGKSILLTGDARGDYLLEGLTAEGQLDAAGKLHVDVLKMPHHGSDRNVEEAFFRDVTADHYVASADGTFGNPDRATMEMLIDARGKDAVYTIHVTYPLADIDARRKDEWEKDRAGEQKKKDTTKPTQVVRRAWNHATDDLGTLFADKQGAGFKFAVAAPATAGPGARIDLLDAIDF